MDRNALVNSLATSLPQPLAEEVVDSFLDIRRDVATLTLGRSAPGKFVETLVQILQFLDTGAYDPQPKVDAYLKALESQSSTLDDGLRICAARIARAMYSLRNKRNIAHKGTIDPNTYDLAFLLHGAQWVLAELVRLTSQISMQEAGSLVKALQVPIDEIIEDFGDRQIVLANLTVKNEILVLLHKAYPDYVSKASLIANMDRRKEATISRALREMWTQKTIEGTPQAGYCLTRKGFSDAHNLLITLSNK